MASATPSALKPIISPSMLSSDFARLAEEAKRMTDSGADWLHMDVMDGHFVPNLTLGAPVVKALKGHVGKDGFLDCHLMVSNPAQWVEDFAKAGADMFTFHIEAADDAAKLAGRARELGMQVGVALKPATPVSDITPLIEAGLIDMALVMTVEPGFGGQSFMADMMPKVRELREAFPTLNIQVDGGLAPSTIDAAATAGANVIVAGTAIFKAEDPAERIASLRASVQAAIDARQ